MLNIAIYGTGSFGQKIFSDLDQRGERCVCFIDEYKVDTTMGCATYSASTLPSKLSKKLDKIYIAISDIDNALNAIKRLLKYNIPSERIEYLFSDIYTLLYIFDYDIDKVLQYKEKASKLDLSGWFSVANQKALIQIVEKINKQDVKLLEVGSWKGLSSSIIAKTIQKNNGTLYCVDTWKGSETVEQQVAESDDHDIFKIFLQNMDHCGLSNSVKTLKMTSFEAADILKDDYFDFIFIDAVHTYDYVNKDIKNFLPKLKNGGIICGDDCEEYYHNLPIEYIEKYKDTDFAPLVNEVEPNYQLGYHCGVIKALYDNFDDDYTIIPGSSVWYKVINKEI